MMLWVNKYKYHQWALLLTCLIFGFISCNNDQKNEEVATASATAATEAPVASEDINNQEKQTGQKVFFYIELNREICDDLISMGDYDTLFQCETYHKSGGLATRGNHYLGVLHNYPDSANNDATESKTIRQIELYFFGGLVKTSASELFSFEAYKDSNNDWRKQYWAKFKDTYPYFFNRTWGNWSITGVIGSFTTEPWNGALLKNFIVTARQINETVSGYGVCPVCSGTGVQYTNLGNRQRCYSCFGNGKSVETSGLKEEKWVLTYLASHQTDSLGNINENISFEYGIVPNNYPSFGFFCNSPDERKQLIYYQKNNTDAEKIMELYNEFEQYILLAMPEKQEFYRKEQSIETFSQH